MSGITVAGTGRYLPEQIVTNDDFAKIIDTSDEWIRERTGIRERHFSTGEPTWYMGAQAAKRCLENAGAEAGEIGLIIACSITQDFYTPSLACVIQGEIGAGNAFCWDLNAACSGFVYALDAAERFLRTGGAECVLLVCSENLSKICDFTDRSSCVLFGDGAAAVLLRKSEAGLFSSYLKSDGSQGSYLLSHALENNSPYAVHKDDPAYQKFQPGKGSSISMAGRDVYRFATKALAESVEEACRRAGVGVAELDLIVPHQANIRIVRTAAERLGVPMDKIYMNIDRYANTSCASIPICLDELNRSGALRPGMKIAMAGFGGGLTYGGIVMQW